MQILTVSITTPYKYDVYVFTSYRVLTDLKAIAMDVATTEIRNENERLFMKL